jgi:hypothetical protein
MPILVIGAAATTSLTVPSITQDVRPFENDCKDMNCHCSICRFSLFRSHNNFVVNAYERRDVGDETSSAETKAMNDQAYETNNRLERDGFVLEVCQSRT